MIYIFYGNDTGKARAQAQKTIAAAKKKHAGAEFFKLTPENFSENKLDELIGNQGLFYSGSIILADNLCEEEEIADKVLPKLKEIKASPNFFVFLEAKLNKPELEKFKKLADKVEEFNKPPAGGGKKLTKKEKLAAKGEKIDFFEFANTLGERNKKQLWALYQDALAEGVPAAELHAIFFWQVKAMLGTVKCKDAGEAGLNPYVFSKAKNYAKNYGKTVEEAEKKLKNMSAELFNMYHNAHRGQADFFIALEKFILEL